MAGGLSLRSRKIRMDRGICNLGKKRKLFSTVCCPARQAGEGGGPQRGGDYMRPWALPLHPVLALLGSHPIRGEAAGRRASFTAGLCTAKRRESCGLQILGICLFSL